MGEFQLLRWSANPFYSKSVVVFLAKNTQNKKEELEMQKRRNDP